VPGVAYSLIRIFADRLFAGMSQVIVSFVLEKNLDVAAQEVRDKV
jgi:hypothetical protein